jgi:hypothetical protein
LADGCDNCGSCSSHDAVTFEDKEKNNDGKDFKKKFHNVAPVIK